jgi:hypothetical protein
MKTKNVNDNVVSLETRVALLEKGTSNIEALIFDLRNGQNALATKLDALFIYIDNKVESIDKKSENRFHILDAKISSTNALIWKLFLVSSGLSIGGFLTIGHKVFGI